MSFIRLSTKLKCYGCGGNHKRENCPTIGTTKCYSCNQIGHKKENCPNINSKPDTIIRCYSCNQSGHKKDVCPNDSKQAQAQQVICGCCETDIANSLFKPCNHLWACTTCSEKIDKCPICRKTVTSREKIYYG